MKRHLRLKELAEYMGVSKRTVRKWCRNGLTKYKVPGSNLIYFDFSDLQKFLIPVNAGEEAERMKAQIADIVRKMQKDGN